MLLAIWALYASPPLVTSTAPVAMRPKTLQNRTSVLRQYRGSIAEVQIWEGFGGGSEVGASLVPPRAGRNSKTCGQKMQWKVLQPSFIGNQHCGKPYAVKVNHTHEELQDLVERVTIELELMNFAKELER